MMYKMRTSPIVVASLLHGSRLFAADITWDASADPGLQGGTGIWSSSATTWTVDDGLSNAIWDNVANVADTAIFGTAGGTVTLGEAIQLRGLKFNTAGYTVTGQSLGFGATQGSIDTSALGSGNNLTTISSGLTGTAGLTIASNGSLAAGGGSSTGRLDLIGDNTGLTGGIAITGGLVYFGSQNAAGANAIALSNGGGLVQHSATALSLNNAITLGTGGGTARVWGSRSLTLTGLISGSGALNKTDSGTLNLSGTLNNTFSGAFNVQSGTTTIGTNFQGTGTGALSVTGGSTLNTFALTTTAATSYGNSSISIDGSTWNFGGSSGGTVTHTYNFAGNLGSTSATDPLTAIQVNNSTLAFTSTNSTTKTFNGRLNFTGNNIINRTSSNFTHNQTFARAIYGSGTLTFNWSGNASARNVNINGTGNNYTGSVILNSSSGTANFVLNQALGASSYEVRNNWNLQNSVAGGLDSAASITLVNAASQLTLTQAWNNTTASLTVTNGTVLIGNAASSIGNLSGAAGVIRGTGLSSSLTVNQTTDAIYAGTLSQSAGNSLAFTKNGTGKLTLTGANDYTGATTVNAGTLNLGTGGSIGASTTTIGAAATLSGFGSIGGSTTIEGIHAPGNSPGIQTFGGGLAYSSTATLLWELFGNTNTGRGTDFDGVDITAGDFSLAAGASLDISLSGTVDLSNAFWTSSREWLVVDLSLGANAADSNVFTLGDITLGGDAFDPSSYGDFGVIRKPGSNSDDSVFLTWTPVPEPSAALLGAAGFLLLLRRRAR